MHLLLYSNVSNEASITKATVDGMYYVIVCMRIESHDSNIIMHRNYTTLNSDQSHFNRTTDLIILRP